VPLDLREIARLRLRNQRVIGEKLSSPADVVAWLGCVQAQEYSLAKWSVGTRVAAAAHDAAVEQSLARGEILRTHILRPTWHFVTPADIRWITRLTAPRVLSGSAHRIRWLELDDAQLGAANDVIARALAGRKHLTRLELQAELDRAGLHPVGQRIAYIVLNAEMSLLVASGTPRDGKQTYALLDEFAPPTATDLEPFDRDHALADLILRYYTSHGPATVADFTWWSGISGAETRRGIAANGTALQSIDVAGEKFWWAGDHGGSADSRPSPVVHLMQAYDEYVVGYKAPRTPINLDGLASPAVLRALPFFHHVVVDTQIAGHWRRLAAGPGYRIETALLRALDSAERAALEAEVGRYADFAQRPVGYGSSIETRKRIGRKWRASNSPIAE